MRHLVCRFFRASREIFDTLCSLMSFCVKLLKKASPTPQIDSVPVSAFLPHAVSAKLIDPSWGGGGGNHISKQSILEK